MTGRQEITTRVGGIVVKGQWGLFPSEDNARVRIKPNRTRTQEWGQTQHYAPQPPRPRAHNSFETCQHHVGNATEPTF